MCVYIYIYIYTLYIFPISTHVRVQSVQEVIIRIAEGLTQPDSAFRGLQFLGLSLWIDRASCTQQVCIPPRVISRDADMYVFFAACTPVPTVPQDFLQIQCWPV